MTENKGSTELESEKRSRRGGQTASLKTVDRALAVLDFLAVFGGQVGVRELAKHLGVNKSSIHSLLATLESHGYAAQDPETEKYQIGSRLLEVSAVLNSQVNLRAVAKPHLQRLARETGEVVHLAVENGGHCLYIEKIAGYQAVRTGSNLGWRRPLYCTGIGKVLLAYLPKDRLLELLATTDLLAYTPNTITDRGRLMDELEGIRESGIAFDREEIEAGLRCVAVPVFGVDGQAVAAISLAGPADRFSPARLEALEELVRGAAESISNDLVFRPQNERLGGEMTISPELKT